jgi:hypothetical protein
MGAWGADAFDNDTAGDWVAELEESSDLSVVADAIQCVVEIGDDYLESDVACEAVAACEVLARLKSNAGKSDAYTEAVDKWVRTHPIKPPPELVSAAITAIDRILGADSELAELWEDDADWQSSMASLRKRVAN